MDLRSDYPYWLLRKGIINSYPSLQKSTTADIVIMGGGISGALIAYELVEAGYNVIVVDRRHIGMGSTAASTSLLQYEIDIPLTELSEKIGPRRAERSYLLCLEAIHKIAAVAQRTGMKKLVEYRPSFQYASFKKDCLPLEKEYLLRKKLGIAVSWLDQHDIKSLFGFSRTGGLLSRDGAAADAYGLTHAILAHCLKKGLRIFDQTEVTLISYGKKDIALHTAGNRKLHAAKLIIACGYESQKYIPKRIQELNSTYVIISEPFIQKEAWYKNAMIWETRQPYLYLRTTGDHRIIVGGKDIPASSPAKRDRLLNAKAKALESAFRKLFPAIPFKTDFKWAGSFASTRDGLPYIGAIRQRPNTFFALGLGGNGITFSMIAAEIIRDMVCGKHNEDAAMFAFDR